MCRNFVKYIAPRERVSTEWRSKKALGAKHAQKLADKMQLYYRPLYALMRLHLDEGMSLKDAVDKIEETRGSNWERWAKGLDTSDASKKRYMRHVLSEDFEKEVRDAFRPVPTPPKQEVVPPSTDPSLSVYLGLDPSTSCGFSIVKLNASRIVSIDVGVVRLPAGESDAARCSAFLERLKSLLDPPPIHIFSESFFGQGRSGDTMNYKVRSVIEMEAFRLSIPFSEVPPQTWKKEIAGDGGAEKEAAKLAIEERMGTSFPAKVYNGEKWTKEKDTLLDASDATGIALAGVKKQVGTLSFADTFSIRALGNDKVLLGKRLGGGGQKRQRSPSAEVIE